MSGLLLGILIGMTLCGKSKSRGGGCKVVRVNLDNTYEPPTPARPAEAKSLPKQSEVQS